MYKSVDLYTTEPGTCTMTFRGESGQEKTLTVQKVDGPAVWQGAHNKEKSIRSFAKACFQYAIDTKQDVWFATKDTISKKYDHHFKDIFQEIFEKEYKEANPDEDFTPLEESVDTLKEIVKHQVGVIELSFLLDIDVVSEIFIRINSKGTALSQSDFVMSKMAADTVHGGNILRKVVDYFCHLAVKPDFYHVISN